MLLVSFCVLVVTTWTIFSINSDFSFGVDSSQINSHNWTNLRELEYHYSDKKIHNMANGGGSLSSTEGTMWFDFRKNCQSELDIPASGWMLSQIWWTKMPVEHGTLWKEFCPLKEKRCTPSEDFPWCVEFGNLSLSKLGK